MFYIMVNYIKHLLILLFILLLLLLLLYLNNKFMFLKEGFNKNSISESKSGPSPNPYLDNQKYKECKSLGSIPEWMSCPKIRSKQLNGLVDFSSPVNGDGPTQTQTPTPTPTPTQTPTPTPPGPSPPGPSPLGPSPPGPSPPWPSPPGPTPSGKPLTNNSKSLWNRIYGVVPSCVPDPSATDPNIAWVYDNDPTKLNIDLTKTTDKRHCFKYAMSDCSFNINDVKEIDFYIDMKDCNDTWAAPLWMVPPIWGPSQHQSGEIDFAESCCGKFNVSFGSTPSYYGKWPVDDDTNVKGHIKISIDKEKDIITTQFCDSNGCKNGFTRTGYFKDILSGSNPDGKGMTFISDIWNGTGGDGGFAGCSKQSICKTNYDSNCNYNISNIRLKSVNNKSLFTNLKCRIMDSS